MNLKLNKEQQQAVLHQDGPLIIKAGAGTGKTAVITHRIAQLISLQKALPDEILALTFTDKAASEMRDRVEQALPESYAYSDFWILTFHSFCERILRNHSVDIGLPVDFRLIDDISSKVLMAKEFDQFDFSYYKPIGGPHRFINTLLTHFSRCKDEMISVENYLNLSKKKGPDQERVKEIALAYQTYQKILLDNNSLDFGDILIYTLKLFKERPLILKKLQRNFKYITIDEFQDTNRIQYEIVNQIAKKRKNIVICLDGNQSIYRWRGASSNNLDLFKKNHPKTETINLSKNYRSFQNILDLSHKFITVDNDKAEPLKSTRKGKGDIEHLHFKSLDMELRGISEKIIEINEMYDFKDIAVLTRTNNDAQKITTDCERRGIPCRFLSMKGLYLKPIILDILAYFRLLDNYHEASAVYRVLSFFLLKPNEIVKLTEYSYKKSQSIYATLTQVDSVSDLSKESVSKIKKIVEMVEKDSLLSIHNSVSEIYISFLNESGLLNQLSKANRIEDFIYLNQFFDRIKQFEESNPSNRLKGFMEEINFELDSGESGSIASEFEEENSVKIMTIHTAKGLEFSHVIIANMVDRRFPADAKPDPIDLPLGVKKTKEDHLKEERRLFYVAMTRAKDGITFTSADDYGGAQKRRISRFLIELGFFEKEPILKDEKYKKNEKKGQLSYGKIKDISFTKIAAYTRCPHQYFFTHVLMIPSRDKPSQIFGKLMHKAIYEFSKARIDRKITMRETISLYKSCWPDDWYGSQKSKKEKYLIGEKIIKRVYNEYKKNPPPIAIIKDKPALEQSFRVKLDDYWIKGKIDSIHNLSDGVEIIDFKTGKFKKRISSIEKDQLVIYQIATERAFGLKVNKLTFNFIEEGEKISFTADQKRKKETLERIFRKAEEINLGEFNPTPGWHCRYCDFRRICEYAK